MSTPHGGPRGGPGGSGSSSPSAPPTPHDALAVPAILSEHGFKKLIYMLTGLTTLKPVWKSSMLGQRRPTLITFKNTSASRVGARAVRYFVYDYNNAGIAGTTGAGAGGNNYNAVPKQAVERREVSDRELESFVATANERCGQNFTHKAVRVEICSTRCPAQIQILDLPMGGTGHVAGRESTVSGVGVVGVRSWVRKLVKTRSAVLVEEALPGAALNGVGGSGGGVLPGAGAASAGAVGGFGLGGFGGGASGGSSGGNNSDLACTNQFVLPLAVMVTPETCGIEFEVELAKQLGEYVPPSAGGAAKSSTSSVFGAGTGAAPPHHDQQDSLQPVDVDVDMDPDAAALGATAARNQQQPKFSSKHDLQLVGISPAASSAVGGAAPSSPVSVLDFLTARDKIVTYLLAYHERNFCTQVAPAWSKFLEGRRSELDKEHKVVLGLDRNIETTIILARNAGASVAACCSFLLEGSRRVLSTDHRRAVLTVYRFAHPRLCGGELHRTTWIPGIHVAR